MTGRRRKQKVIHNAEGKITKKDIRNYLTSLVAKSSEKFDSEILRAFSDQRLRTSPSQFEEELVSHLGSPACEIKPGGLEHRLRSIFFP